MKSESWDCSVESRGETVFGSKPHLVSLYLRPLVRSSLITPEGLCFRSGSSLTSSPAAQHSIFFTRLIDAECYTVFLIIIWQFSLADLHKLFPADRNSKVLFGRLGRNLNVSEQNNKKETIGFLDVIVLNYRLMIWMRLDFFFFFCLCIGSQTPLKIILPSSSPLSVWTGKCHYVNTKLQYVEW